MKTLRYAVPGLSSPAEIVVDRHGIPHLRAAGRPDLYFLQGFNAARDRLWQLEIWRRRGLGLLAEAFGPGFLEQDRAARLFLYRGDMAAEWAAYGVADAEAIATRFTAGINAYIGLTEADPDLLPPEFAMMGLAPSRWAPADVVRVRSHALVRNVQSEALRARVVAAGGPGLDLLRRHLSPSWEAAVPDGLDPADVGPDVIDALRLATAAIDISPERLAAGMNDAVRWSKVDEQGNVLPREEAEGSNNWAVAPSRTATGRPVLANDPHRAHALPSLRYIVHLTAPDLDVIGAGEPAQPGVSIGHNGRAAFGLTIFPGDQEDLYVYETDPKDPTLYRYADGWERMTTVTETFRVKGAAAVTRTLSFTRHGPVVHQDGARNRAFAVRSVWFEPGTSAYLANLAYIDADTPEAFAAALDRWCAPTVNQVYADTAGNIARFTAGMFPQRPNWDGLMPVPGDGRYEWAGFHRRADLPAEVNPPRGYVYSANEMNLPDDYPYGERKLGFEWSERSRAGRIDEVLGADTRHDVAASMRLQGDVTSLPARRAAAVLARLGPASGDLGAALALLSGWDHRLATDSAAAALFEVWWVRHLKAALIAAVCPDPALRPLLVPADNESVLAIIEGTAAGLPRLPGPDELDGLLAGSLAAAFAECRERLGTDPAFWAWGRLHHGYFEHVLSRLRPAAGRRDWDVGPLPKGGSGSAVMNAGYRLPDFRVTSGASFRLVVDVGDWDGSRVINAPGQSGDPRSPYYGNLSESWSRAEFVPLLYSAAAVEAAAELRIALEPAAG